MAARPKLWLFPSRSGVLNPISQAKRNFATMEYSKSFEHRTTHRYGAVKKMHEEKL